MRETTHRLISQFLPARSKPRACQIHVFTLPGNGAARGSERSKTACYRERLILLIKGTPNPNNLIDFALDSSYCPRA